MAVSLQTLRSDLLTNVAEIRFVRREAKVGATIWRRMLCTNSYDLLNSINGRTTLNYDPVTQFRLNYNPAMKNLLPTWDIIRQDYRNINMDKCEIIQLIPTDQTFWQWFNANIYPMDRSQREAYLNS